ncbi:MAG: glycoside hydrolase family 9 protein [Lacunisphaera sp.]
MELHALTKDAAYLEQAKVDAPPRRAGGELGRLELARECRALRRTTRPRKKRLYDELAGYLQHAATQGAPWGVPGRYSWGSLPCWIGMANAVRLGGDSPEARALFWNMTDYVFGRNNWGASFLFDEGLRNTLLHLYSPTYKLLHKFPTGALSEGPGDRATHDSLAKYFSVPADDSFRRFNTPAGVFCDDDTDFMCQEATIFGQAEILVMLALAAPPTPSAPPRYSPPTMEVIIQNSAGTGCVLGARIIARLVREKPPSSASRPAGRRSCSTRN